MILMLVMVQGCTKLSGNFSQSTSGSKNNFTAESKLHLVEIEIKSNMIINTLQIQNLRLKDGEIVLRLISPDGKMKWEKRLTAPSYLRETFDLETDPGKWKLEIDLKNATGKYQVLWKASA
jgi:hypothetical protein